jgi:hypothetical protein
MSDLLLKVLPPTLDEVARVLQFCAGHFGAHTLLEQVLRRFEDLCLVPDEFDGRKDRDPANAAMRSAVDFDEMTVFVAFMVQEI